MAERKAGFYEVLLNCPDDTDEWLLDSDDWQPAFWDGRKWWVIGASEPLPLGDDPQRQLTLKKVGKLIRELWK